MWTGSLALSVRLKCHIQATAAIDPLLCLRSFLKNSLSNTSPPYQVIGSLSSFSAYLCWHSSSLSSDFKSHCLHIFTSLKSLSWSVSTDCSGFSCSSWPEFVMRYHWCTLLSSNAWFARLFLHALCIARAMVMFSCSGSGAISVVIQLSMCLFYSYLVLYVLFHVYIRRLEVALVFPQVVLSTRWWSSSGACL